MRMKQQWTTKISDYLTHPFNGLAKVIQLLDGDLILRLPRPIGLLPLLVALAIGVGWRCVIFGRRCIVDDNVTKE